ncbi:MAG: alpha-mannosidase, partial [Clostridia bacterium]|nr:alpha-mannosidase [Clostridia bacterium]
MDIEKRIYTVADAHLDTVWNWDFEYTIGTCIYNTLVNNFKKKEKYPDYKFNFEGSYRYELMEEYYPELFEQLKKYVAEGKWNVAGSCYENGDVNVPSPELLFRNILYGNSYFEKKFGKRSKDIFLPDCFGFGWALPSIAEHGNLKGFITQKLEWGSAYGIPFDIGRWRGINGRTIYASLDSKNYTTSLKKVRKHKPFEEKLKNNEKKYDIPWTFGFHGTGDQGGSPEDSSVQTVCSEMSSNNNPKVKVKVLSAKADQIFEDLDKLPPEQTAKLPVWENELVMTNHGAGAYTSRAFSKRCNRRNEELADLAERSCVTAEYLLGAPYPKIELEKAWKRNIAHTFHDDITGTSLQRIYKRSWNDYVMSSNQFCNAYEGAAGEIVKQLDTNWAIGVPVVVNNHFEFARKGA